MHTPKDTAFSLCEHSSGNAYFYVTSSGVLKLIEKYLYGTNVEVLRASNGQEAVEIFLSVQNLDLILMDIKMPLMDGYEATKVIRESNTNIPIIAQSAYTDDEIRVLECGFSSIIIKPFNKGELIRTIKEYI